EELPPVSKTITVTVPYNPPESDDGENNDESGANGEDEENGENGENEENKEDDTESKPKEQTVKIYIDDMNNDIEDIYQEDTITEDTDYEFRLTIEANKTAEYKIVRDDEVIKNKTVTYEEGE